MYIARAKQVICALFALLSLSVTLYSIVKFVLFVSTPSWSGKIDRVIKSSEWKQTIRTLFYNTIWLVLFILHHSFGKHESIKKFWEKIGFKNIERAVYNIVSSLILLQMVERWTIANKWTLWSFTIKEYSPVWYIYVLSHAVLWLIIFGGSLLMDLPEILGIKQVYYNVKGLNDPSLYKAIQHNRLLASIRHPSYIGFSLLFWITNLMSLDRFILATLLSLYMFVAWSPDLKDYEYQKQQLELKKLELRYDFKQK
ncbi:hypothetical protein PVAND_012117 [Polypedilum vanderplanki]|uniref:Nuclear envelope membrane protein n=1 Tax=Polypedilum vanderplanki TaxID=319348 RepID=A0A9J6CKM5_POLVA|nr:hypothetical protein PVAND_012117 [Polypedilum vanderplanki]